MKKRIICLLALAPIILAGCKNDSTNASSDEVTSSNKGGEFVSSAEDVGSKGDGIDDSIGSKPTNYEKLTQDYFNELKNNGLMISGTVNWEFSGEVTDATYGTTYDASEKINVTKFVGKSSSILNSEIRYAGTGDNQEADDSYNFRVFRNAKGKMVRLYLGADNVVHESVYTMQETDDDGYTVNVPVSYDTYFANPFTLIEYSDIRDNKDGTYNITSYSADDFGVAALFSGGLIDIDEMKSVVLTLKDGTLHLDIESNHEAYEDDTSVYNWFVGSFDITIADKTDIEKPVAYEEDPDNLPLKNAFLEISNALKEGGNGVTFSYSEFNGDATYKNDVTYMTPEGFVSEFSDSGKVPSGVAKYNDGNNYFFEVRNGKVLKSGKNASLLLPGYGEDSLSAYIFQKDDENVYTVKTRSLALYAAYTMFDYYHIDAIGGTYSSYDSVEGTSDLRVTLENGHLKSIDYNYVYFGKKIVGTCVISDIGDTELGYPFKTKQLGPVQKGYENFMGDFYSYDYGTAGREKNMPQWGLRIFGDGQYCIMEKSTYSETFGENPEMKQGVLNGDTFTVKTPDNMDLTLKYYPANSEFDLGYGSLTERIVPVLFGQTKNGEHKFTFALDPYSEWNKDSGLLDTDSDSGEIA